MRSRSRSAPHLGPGGRKVASSLVPQSKVFRGWQASPDIATAPLTTIAAADIAVGIVFGVLAGSNLIQGAWLRDYPWLDLTTVAFALALPISLAGLRRSTNINVALLILLLMFALALGYLEPALSNGAAQKRLNLIIGVAFVFIASYLSLSNPRRLKWFFVTLVCLAIPVIAGQAVAPDPIALATGRRTPIGLNAIGAGRAVGSALVLVLTMLVVQTKHRLSLGFLALVLGVSLYTDGSRGPVVGVLIAIVLMVWVHPTLRRVPKIASLVTLGAFVVFVYQRSVSVGSRLADLTSSGRNQLYTQAVRVAAEHPLGIGWGNFHRFAPAGSLGPHQNDNLYAHSIILEFWIEAGVLGALAFAAVSATILSIAFKHAARSGFGLALAALLVSLLTGAMLSSDVIGNRMLWVVFGAVLAMKTTVAFNGASAAQVVPGENRARRHVGTHR